MRTLDLLECTVVSGGVDPDPPPPPPPQQIPGSEINWTTTTSTMPSGPPTYAWDGSDYGEDPNQMYTGGTGVPPNPGSGPISIP